MKVLGDSLTALLCFRQMVVIYDAYYFVSYINNGLTKFSISIKRSMASPQREGWGQAFAPNSPSWIVPLDESVIDM